MPRIDVAPDDLAGWMKGQPSLAAGLGALSEAVYDRNTMPMREREIARYRIALANHCEVCLATRDAKGIEAGVTEEMYDHVLEWATWPGYSERERLCAEFAERFAADHEGLRDDDAFWDRMHACFSDAEIVDLGICCALWLGAGRLMRTLDVAQACSLTLHQ